MFLKLPFFLSNNLQQTVLILNTVLLIVGLIVYELVYSEVEPQKRLHLRYFLPLLAVLGGLLIYAAYLQAGKS